MKKSPVILVVEDNPGDVRLIKEALNTSSIEPILYFARDGLEATRFLETRMQDGLPHLMVLDLNLPKKSGFQVLQFVKCHEMLKRIPVIVLSSSQSQEDVAKAYDWHANCYLTKPTNFEAYIAVVQALAFFWVRIANLP